MPHPFPKGRLPQGVLAAVVFGGLAGMFSLPFRESTLVGCLTALFLLFLVPLCLGRFAGRYASAATAAVAYAGSFALVFVAAAMALKPYSHFVQGAPAIFTTLFALVLVPSLLSALLGAFCDWLVDAIRRPLAKNSEASTRSEAIQVGRRLSDGTGDTDGAVGADRTDRKELVRSCLYRRSHF
jgi:hypothetical protein